MENQDHLVLLAQVVQEEILDHPVLLVQQDHLALLDHLGQLVQLVLQACLDQEDNQAQVALQGHLVHQDQEVIVENKDSLGLLEQPVHLDPLAHLDQSGDLVQGDSQGYLDNKVMSEIQDMSLF